MPNGDYEWIDNELPKVKVFFKKISGVLNKFTKDHNLKIEKYYHYIPGWEFLFKHPLGGRCYIEILKSDEKYVTLMTDWSTYDYEAGISRNKHTKRAVCGINEAELENKLNEMLKMVLSWTENDLSVISKRAPEYKEAISKEEFEKDLERYPIPEL